MCFHSTKSRCRNGGLPLPSSIHVVRLRWELIEMHGPVCQTVVLYAYAYARKWWLGDDKWHSHWEK